MNPSNVTRIVDCGENELEVSKSLQDRNGVSEELQPLQEVSGLRRVDNDKFLEWDPRTTAADVLTAIEGYVPPEIRKHVADLILHGNHMTFGKGQILGQRKAHALDRAAKRSAKAMDDFHRIINEQRARKGKPPLS